MSQQARHLPCCILVNENNLPSLAILQYTEPCGQSPKGIVEVVTPEFIISDS